MSEKKKCIECGERFVVEDRDLSFYKKISPTFNGIVFNMPLPQLCPKCRLQRRWAVRNQSKLYKRKCDFSGKEMVSLYAPDSKHVVYSEDIWWSDKWDPMKYGKEYNNKKSVFDQFRELQLQIPRRGMQQDGTNENCEYTTFGMNNKNCYLAFACFGSEDIYYSSWSVMSRDIVDCLLAFNSELLYECIHCDKCYKSIHCKNCNGCSECYFMEDCSNCQNCIGCKNITNKQYYIYNQPSTKKEYERLRAKLQREGFESEKEKYDKWKLLQPNRYAHIIASENCDGDYIYNSKNCHNCFGIFTSGAESCQYCHMCGSQAKDMADCAMSGYSSELLYEMQATSGAYKSAFVSFCRFSKHVYYCDSISSCEHCFGCIGLNNKKYCIFNKQYTKDEYEKKVAEIVKNMEKEGEWGEYFPIQNSPFPYNNTLAQDYFPLSKKEIIDREYQYKADDRFKPTKPVTVLDKDIEKVGEEILEAVLSCKSCGKNYKIIPQEYRLYKILKVSIPRKCPDCRHTTRMSQIKALKLHHRQCMCEEPGHGHEGRCKNEFETTYAPDRPEKVYCEECYQKSVL